MKSMHSGRILIPLLLLFVAVVVYHLVWDDAVDYNTEVKPILNRHCIGCHGGVKKSGGFSLLFREDALAPTQSGVAAIQPGNPHDSEMFRRLISDDPEERMPFEKDPLSKEEITILRKWIKQGAKWDVHWAYQPVKKTEPPARTFFSAILNGTGADASKEIDLFIDDKLKTLNLERSPSADKATLLRRVSLDLTGKPPSASLAEWFLSSDRDDAYDLLVDSLLNAPAYGERWTALWLDLARYADTKGYERDDVRRIWRYRDWLIRAFNQDMPYDQFLVEQLAGDLFPEPTDDQYIATAFHRNTMTNDEGGTDNEEFRVAAVIDRVNTTWEVLMGTTFSCVQCHGHPYDPIIHEDYYKFMAFFNNTRDEDTYAEYPLLRHFNAEDSSKLTELKSWLLDQTTDAKTDEIVKFVKTWQPSINSLTSDQFVNSELADTKWLNFRNHGRCRLARVSLSGKSNLIFRYKSWKEGGIWTIRLDSAGGQLLTKVDIPNSKGGWRIDEISVPPVAGTHDLYLSFENPNISDPNARGLMFDWFHFTDPFPGGNSAGYEQAHSTYWNLLRVAVPTTPIMMENPAGMRRPTHIFERGNWLSKGETVSADVPDMLPPLPATAAKDRMGLAMWIVSTENPLTARTMVNRLWEQLFGRGLSETLEDLGSQGQAPTHPELLDHLSWKFMHEYRWSIKALLREMVLSDTYRQRSIVRPEHLERDPFNLYYARASRVRLTAEQLRDQALAASGLLSEKMYGPSVMPHQPDGIWLSPYNGAKWIKSEGEDQYRRALYTYWKRTAPYPSMELFDIMTREVCASRRINTNTPLQALVTMNDSTFLEAAAHLADRMVNNGGANLEEKINHGYRRLLYKEISSEKMETMVDLYHRALEAYSLAAADSTDNPVDRSPEKRSLTLVANALLNIDEVITKN
jgi:hypothetical protein